MASLKDIRARIETTKNTQKITKAMKLVSAAKLRRAQNNIVSLRPYALTLRKVISDIAVAQKISHPLMEPKANPRKVLLVVLTSDRGLCGGFNANINKFSENYIAENKNRYDKIDFFFIGRKANDYFVKRGVKPIESMSKLDKDISYELAAAVSTRLLKTFLDGHYDEIRMIHNEFKSAISQTAVAETLLPVSIEHSSLIGESNNANFSQEMIN